MGSMHAQVYAQLRQARVVGVVERRTAVARNTLKQVKLSAPVFSSLGDAMARVPVDAVDVCLPTDLHAGVALEAMAAGKHVFCEKPIALSLADARRMVAAAERAGVFLQVGQCIRFWPEYQALTRLVRQGRFGVLQSLSLQRRASRPAYSDGDWLNDERRSGGAALDLHIHDTDFVHHLIGRPRAVTAAGTRDSSGWSHIFTTYHFDGCAVTAEGGWNYPKGWGFQMAFQAVLEGATVEFDSRNSPSLLITPAKGRSRPLSCPGPKAGTSSLGSGNIASLGGYFNELAAFLRCLERGRYPTLATGEQAAQSLATVLAEIASARTGKTVRLPRLRKTQ